MEKAVLFMAMPKNCGSCPCSYKGEYDMCSVTDEAVNFKRKPEWCPLATWDEAKAVFEAKEKK